MIEQTFVHMPGVGPSTESRLWQNGYKCWDDVLYALSRGAMPRDLYRIGRQMLLFGSDGAPASSDGKGSEWLRFLEESKAALRNFEFDFFLRSLNPGAHWRVLDEVREDALYLDIETTGLSQQLNYVTVIGALFRDRMHQWVWPEPLEKLAELLSEARVVVTFNGGRFDLPFLRHHAPYLPSPKAHIDLLHITRGLGIKGGQKAAELEFGLERGQDLAGFEGSAAVASWCQALYGDRKSYDRLLRYNAADVQMMRRLADVLCFRHAAQTGFESEACSGVGGDFRNGHRPSSFGAMQKAWVNRRPGLHRLQPKLTERFGRDPIIVGIDLRAKAARPTGMAVCVGAAAKTWIAYEDAEILEATLAAKPDLVSIDAPLFLPRGRISVSDESPCRKFGIVRDAERILWSRRIPVYPALIRQMQGLTKRGIELTNRLRAEGIEVIESYPGAAQDILGIPRKGLDLNLLDRGLRQFGFDIGGTGSHDELDAVTSALVGYFYLADCFEGLGADDEGFMIVPKWTDCMAWQTEASLDADLA